jgi:hypothetical protein
MAKKEKTSVSEKIHTFKLTRYSNGEVVMSRENRGFTPFELLGYCEQIQLETLEMMSGKMQPTIVERNFVKPTKTKKND